VSTTALRVRHWSGLVVAPLAFLSLISVAYALVPWVCATQQHWVLHVVSAVTLVTIAAVGIGGWQPYDGLGGQASGTIRTQRLLATVSLGVSALCALATIALWLTEFAISPCLS
jgi:hypothetical protein